MDLDNILITNHYVFYPNIQLDIMSAQPQINVLYLIMVYFTNFNSIGNFRINILHNHINLFK